MTNKIISQLMQTDFGGKIPLPGYSTTDYLISLCASINFMETWINLLANNYAWRYSAYQENMKEIFKQIPTEIPTPTLEYFKIKCLTLFTVIGGDWYLNVMCNPEPPMNNPRLSKKEEEE